MTLRDLVAAVQGWIDADDRVGAADRAVDPLTATATWQAWELAMADGTLARLTVEVRP